MTDAAEPTRIAPPSPPFAQGCLALIVKTFAVLFIIFVALCVILPFFTSGTRQAANKMLCANKLKQLGIAAHDYHSAYDRLPPGWLGPNPDSPDHEGSPNVGVLVELFQYMEQDLVFVALYYQRELRAESRADALNPKTNLPYVPPAHVPWWNLTNPKTGTMNTATAAERIRMLECPSDDPYKAAEGVFVALHTYGRAAPRDFLKHTVFHYQDRPEAREFGRTNYVGVAGCAGRGSEEVIPGTDGQRWSLYEGIFCNRSKTTLGELAFSDGTSNTLMFGETLGGFEPREEGGADERRFSFSWFCGALPTMYGLPENGPWYAFGSRHSGVVQFCRGDGSVIGIRRGATTERFSQDWWVFQELAGKRDGGLRRASTLID